MTAATSALRENAPSADRAGLRGFLDAAISRARNQSAMLAVLAIEVPAQALGGLTESEVERRLRQCARRSDFVAQSEDGSWRVIAEYMDGPYAAHRLAHRMLDLLEKTDGDAGACAPGCVSIGIATGSGFELDAERLLQRTATAMRRASREGGRRLVDAGT